METRSKRKATAAVASGAQDQSAVSVKASKKRAKVEKAPAGEKASKKSTLPKNAKKGKSTAAASASASSTAAAAAASATNATATLVDKLIEKVRKTREAAREAQAKDAKAKGWTFDPRPPVCVEPSLYDLCGVDGLNCLDAVVDFHIKKYTYVLKKTEEDDDSELPPPTPLENYCSQVVAEIPGFGNLSDEEVMAFGLNRLFQLVPATYISSKVGASAAEKSIGKDVPTLLMDGLDMEQLLADHPCVPYFSDVTPVDDATEDEKDAEAAWCEKFSNHMEWLFEQFDKRRCDSLGRIHAALGLKKKRIDDESLTKEFQQLALSRLGGSCWRRTEALAKKEDASNDEDGEAAAAASAAEPGAEEEEDSDTAYQAVLAVMRRQHVARHAVLSYPLQYRTYVGTFCFNIRESDYDGSRCGIADYCGDSAEEFFNPQEFVQVAAVGGDIDTVDNIVTSAFYIPGQKGSEGNEEEGEEGGEGEEEE